MSIPPVYISDAEALHPVDDLVDSIAAGNIFTSVSVKNSSKTHHTAPEQNLSFSSTFPAHSTISTSFVQTTLFSQPLRSAEYLIQDCYSHRRCHNRVFLYVRTFSPPSTIDPMNVLSQHALFTYPVLRSRTSWPVSSDVHNEDKCRYCLWL